MRERINTVLLGVITVLLLILVLKPEMTTRGRFQPIGNTHVYALDTKTGRTCSAGGKPISWAGYTFPACKDLD